MQSEAEYRRYPRTYQIPYVLCVAACCFLGYLAAGITANGWVGTGVGFAALIVVLVILDRKNKGTKEA